MQTLHVKMTWNEMTWDEMKMKMKMKMKDDHVMIWSSPQIPKLLKILDLKNAFCLLISF